LYNSPNDLEGDIIEEVKDTKKPAVLKIKLTTRFVMVHVEYLREQCCTEQAWDAINDEIDEMGKSRIDSLVLKSKYPQTVELREFGEFKAESCLSFSCSA
jgi:hypothetical protein